MAHALIKPALAHQFCLWKAEQEGPEPAWLVELWQGGEQPPSPRPNSISKLNGLAEEPVNSLTQLLAGWVVLGRATERAVAKQGEPWAPSRVAGALRE